MNNKTNALLLAFTLSAGILIVGLTLQGEQMHARAYHPEQSPQPLTKYEEQDLQRLLPQTLEWAARWEEPTNCLGQDAKLDIAEKIRQSQGEEIQLHLEIAENKLLVSADSLHLFLSFTRLYEKGLTPPGLYRFCEETYADYLSARERADSSWRDAVKENPALMERLEHTSLTTHAVSKEEVRMYALDTFRVYSPAREVAKWSDEKRELYDRIVETVRHEANLGCEDGKSAIISIPDFNVGDPIIYVSIKDGYYGPDELRVLKVTLDRDHVSGKFTAMASRSFGIDNEQKSFVKKISLWQVATFKIHC